MEWIVNALLTAASGIAEHLVGLAAAAIAGAAIALAAALRDRWEWLDALVSEEEVEKYLISAARYVKRHAKDYARRLGKEDLDAPDAAREIMEIVEREAPEALARAGLTRDAVRRWAEELAADALD